MRFSSVESIRWEPGSIVRCELSSSSAREVDVSPSENERFHVDAFRRSGSAGWLAVAIDLPFAVTIDDLQRATLQLVRRHEILRCHFDVDTTGDYRRHRTDADDVACIPTHLDSVAPAADPVATVISCIERSCSPIRPMSHAIIAITRTSSTTVVMAFDHCYVDAYSLAIIAREVVTDLGIDDSPPSTTVAGPEHDSVFLDHRRTEDDATPIDEDDPRLTAWGDFFAATNWEIPQFPIDLGLGPQEKAPMRTELHTLLDADGAARFRTVLHGEGIRSFPALLTAATESIARLGGPSDLAMILPVRTRFGRHHLEAIGWMVGNAPIIATTGTDLIAACHSNTVALADAIPLAEVPLGAVYHTYGDRLRRRRDDVFMVSYVDYNRLPIPGGVVATHISGSRSTDTAQWWFSHDQNGIHVRLRYPDTTVAASMMSNLTVALIGLVHDLADSRPANAMP